MAKIKKTPQPKKSVRKVVKKTVKVVEKKTVVKNTQMQEYLAKLKKVNLLPIAILLTGIFILVALFIYVRKTIIVATINGQPISRFEVIKTLEQQGAKQVVDSLVSKNLLLQKAKQQKIEVTQEEIDKEIDKIKEQIKDQGQDLETVLATQGLTEKDLVEQIRLRSVLEKLLADKIKVSDKEVQQYIEKNRESYPEEMKESELKKTVREQLENQKLSSSAQELLSELKTNASIKYYVTY